MKQKRHHVVQEGPGDAPGAGGKAEQEGEAVCTLREAELIFYGDGRKYYRVWLDVIFNLKGKDKEVFVYRN